MHFRHVTIEMDEDGYLCLITVNPIDRRDYVRYREERNKDSVKIILLDKYVDTEIRQNDPNASIPKAIGFKWFQDRPSLLDKTISLIFSLSEFDSEYYLLEKDIENMQTYMKQTLEGIYEFLVLRELGSDAFISLSELDNRDRLRLFVASEIIADIDLLKRFKLSIKDPERFPLSLNRATDQKGNPVKDIEDMKLDMLAGADVLAAQIKAEKTSGRRKKTFDWKQDLIKEQKEGSLDENKLMKQRSYTEILEGGK